MSGAIPEALSPTATNAVIELEAQPGPELDRLLLRLIARVDEVVAAQHRAAAASADAVTPIADLDVALVLGRLVQAAGRLVEAERVAGAQQIVRHERQRIARDLHDHVVQRLFATGLGLRGLITGVADPDQSVRLNRLLEEIEESIRQVRASIFELGGSVAPAAGGIRRQVGAVADDVAPLLGFDPTVRFCGPVDRVPDDVVGDVVAVTREALTNVVRHAHASCVRVRVSTDGDRLVTSIVDNGTGITGTGRRSGLANLAYRAARHGGTCFVMDARDRRSGNRRGTRLTWTIPVG